VNWIFTETLAFTRAAWISAASEYSDNFSACCGARKGPGCRHNPIARIYKARWEQFFGFRMEHHFLTSGNKSVAQREVSLMRSMQKQFLTAYALGTYTFELTVNNGSFNSFRVFCPRKD
jgi:hypothetical protein